MSEDFYPPGDFDVAALKVPPNSIQAEQSVLGGLMLDNETWDAVADKLIEEDFYRRDHRLIFKSIAKLAEHQDPFDVITLSEILEATNQLSEVGGLAYLGMLVKDTPSAANIAAYAAIVRDRSILRQLIHVGTDISDSAFLPEGRDTAELLENAERKVFKIAEQRQKGDGGFEPIKSLLATAVDKIETLFEQESNITGAATGFADFDEKTSGLQPGDLIIVAGRPSMGKTSFAMNIAENIAIEGKKNVAVFSMEMPGDSLAMRMMSSIGRIDQHKVRTGQLAEDEWPRLTSAINMLAETNIFIDDTPALTPTEVRSRARRLARDHGQLGLIVLDYIQLMHSPSSGENRVQQVGDISRGLKALAKEMNVPVVALSQLNRNLEQRPNKRPVMSDLRESGCLTGDSLVTRADTGERIAIKKLVGEKNFSVWALNEKTLKLEATTVSKVFSTGVKPVFRLTTQLGRTISATANHKFYTSKGWKRLDELTTESYLALPRHLPEIKYPLNLDTSELALLAHLIGDGCTLPRHSIQYTTRELDLAKIVLQLATDIFPTEINPRIKKERTWYQVYLSSTRKHTHGVRNAISVWLDDLGVFGLRSYEKYVPQEVFQQPKDNIALFLKHLWVTDGCIKLITGKKTKPSIYYASSSYQLSRDVQSLLLRVGINARLTAISQGTKGRMQHHVIVSGKIDILCFIEIIGTIGLYKTQSLEEIRLYYQSKVTNTNRDIIPCHLWMFYVKPAMQRQSISTRSFYAGIDTAYAGMTIFKQNVSRERARRITKVIDSKALNKLAESDIYWDKIASIQAVGEENVYDLTVPHLHNFVVNDIIAHNSIEQDADLIVFIYRDEVYNDESPDKGTAEIIIGKQRNGPLGVTRLTFLGQYTKFENYAGDPYNDGDYE